MRDRHTKFFQTAATIRKDITTFIKYWTKMEFGRRTKLYIASIYSGVPQKDSTKIQTPIIELPFVSLHIYQKMIIYI